MTLPFCSLSSDTSNFVKETYDLGWITDFNWPRWSQTPEALVGFRGGRLRSCDQG